MSDLTILAIPGSLRTSSINASLVRATTRLAPAGVTVQTYRGLRDLPHYDADLDLEPAPDEVRELRERIAAAHGVLIATPEYNGGVPGVLKNALDWASTPHGASALTGMPIAVMGATPGRSGTAGAQAQLRQVLARIGCDVVEGPELAISKAYDRFDNDGRLTDEMVAKSVAELMNALQLTVRQSQLTEAAV